MQNIKIIPKENNENNREYAYRLLRYNIMTFNLLPGQNIQESTICKILNISRTPVHEALSQLKNEQLMDIVPQSHSKVSLISLSRMREAIFMRRLLEPTICQQLCGVIASEHLNRLKELLDEMEPLTLLSGDQNTHQFLYLDNEFHKTMYIAAQKPSVWVANSLVSSHYDRVRHQGSIINEQDLNHIHQQHLILYEYLLVGNPTMLDVHQYYSEHLYYFKSFFPTLIRKYPQYFTD